jgi:hypothetical protein
MRHLRPFLLAVLLAAVALPALADPPIRPDHRLTPGAVFAVTVAQIRVPGYSRRVRNVPQSEKDAVYAEYGIRTHRPREYEVDHLISLELGGSNSIRNLWPESYLTQPWNAHVKDRLEDRLHALVCDGQLPLATAQHAIATDWIAAYKRYVGAGAPRIRHRISGDPAAARAPPATGGQVWVNTKTGIYHLPGSRWYGKTSQGEYMSQHAADAAGYRVSESNQG